jgi:hypothetical protein
MSNPGRYLILAAVTVALVVIAWIAYDTQQASLPQASNNTYDAVKLKEIKKKTETVEKAKKIGDPSKLDEAEQSLIEAIGGRAGKMVNMARARNLPIEMYGKVIDQHGNAVAGAEVFMMVAGGGTFAPGSGPVRATTNAEGIFRVQAIGQDITIGAIKHAQLTPPRFAVGEAVAGSRRLLAVDSNGKEYNWRSHTTQDKPFVINVWRVEKFESVKSGSGGFLPIPNDKEDVQAGIVASCEREPKDPNTHWRHQKGSWSITFRPIDGGIQETNDIYLNEAPEGGYQKELTVAMKRGDPGYKVNIQPARRYYYTAHNGKWYGSFSATFDPYMIDDKCLVKMSFKYNPNGSRNLAVKPRY